MAAVAEALHELTRPVIWRGCEGVFGRDRRRGGFWVATGRAIVRWSFAWSFICGGDRHVASNGFQSTALLEASDVVVCRGQLEAVSVVWEATFAVRVDRQGGPSRCCFGRGSWASCREWFASSYGRDHAFPVGGPDGLVVVE